MKEDLYKLELEFDSKMKQLKKKEESLEEDLSYFLQQTDQLKEEVYRMAEGELPAEVHTYFSKWMKIVNDFDVTSLNNWIKFRKSVRSSNGSMTTRSMLSIKIRKSWNQKLKKSVRATLLIFLVGSR